MNAKKVLIISTLALVSCSFIAMAADYPRPMIVNIGPNGSILMRGTILSLSNNALTVKSWAGNWTVNVSSATTIMPSIALSQMKIGDFVGVQGLIDSNASLTINASLVRDWSYVHSGQITINGISGPTYLNVGQSGNWTINTQNSGNNLSYAVMWGDELNYAPTDHAGAAMPSPIFLQTATFSHTYTQAGTYTIAFTVRNNLGQTATSTMNVTIY